MFDCPPVPPACTDTYSKVGGVFFPQGGNWPYLTLNFHVITGLPITEFPNACDVVNGSAWACVTPQNPDDDVLEWDWHMLASGLYWPVDGSNTWEWPFSHAVHLRDWNLFHPNFPFQAVTFRCVGVNLDHSGIGLTCPSEVAPAAGGCIPWLLPQGYWPYDLNQSGFIEVRDVLEVLQNWGEPWDNDDLLLLLQHWGESNPWSIPEGIHGNNPQEFPESIRKLFIGDEFIYMDIDDDESDVE